MSTGATAMQSLRAELFGDVAAVVCDLLKQHGLPADVCEQAGNAAADVIAEDWAGQVISVPKDFAYKLAQRDRDVLAAIAGGESIASVASRLNLHVRSVYRIIKRADLRDRTRRQPGLF